MTHFEGAGCREENRLNEPLFFGLRDSKQHLGLQGERNVLYNRNATHES